MKKGFKIALCAVVISVLTVTFIPQNLKMPVQGAGLNSFHHETFWYEGWGTSIVHKGVDVFAKKGTPMTSATLGLVLATGEYGKGGKFVVILGPKWRLHYYAHLDEIHTSPLSIVTQDTEIGTVGKTGNARTTPPHLHYGIATLIPYPWRIDDAPLGWQKMFYLNPIDYLKESLKK
ncbi:MAG: M23 family metallopeptidase [Bacteroidaceae bacterium]|nr:M23 family metallopeptidase [Bacteroidaceae bacterium]